MIITSSIVSFTHPEQAAIYAQGMMHMYARMVADCSRPTPHRVVSRIFIDRNRAAYTALWIECGSEDGDGGVTWPAGHPTEKQLEDAPRVIPEKFEEGGSSVYPVA